MIKIDENMIESYIQNDESFCHVKQYAILAEECAELAKATSKMARAIPDNQHISILSIPYAEYDKLRDSIVEAMAHVLISCRVISKLAGITDSYTYIQNDESFCHVKQYAILAEECAELAKATSKMARAILDNQHISILSIPYAEYDKLRDSIVEAMAHVLISCRVISKLAGITDSYIQEKIDEKQAK